MDQRPALPALTGLRFVAAVQVVLFHTRSAAPGLQRASFLDPFGGGYSGVSLFFVLSGFILAYNYLTPDGNGVRSVRSFLVARVARIYAVYALGVAIGIPVLIAEASRHGGVMANARFLLAVIAANLTLVQAWIPAYACRLNCPGWSLSVEAFFYLLFPLLGWWLCRRRTAALLVIAAACLALAYGAALLYLRVDPDKLGTVTAASYATWLSVMKFNPAIRLPEFALGIALGMLYLRAPQALGHRAAIVSLVAFGVACVGLAAHERLPYLLVHNGLLAPVYCVLIFALAAGQGPLARLLSTRPLKQLGEASFALYLLHVPLIGYCARLFALGGITQNDASWPWALMYLVACQVTALAVLHWIEEPSRVAIKRWLSPSPRTD
ncbi:MAG: acyltransferase [Gemmatimonadaceae bacterium]|nr:acyltransferase [Gemmatimonadaceae bacterium]